MGWDIRTDAAKTTLYFICVGMLFLCLFIARLVQNRKLGRILVAMNAQEMRVRFSGYDVAAFKIFVFCLAAAFAGIGGAMFTLIVGFMSPSFIGIVASIEMVIFCALGGRLSILGAVYGALLVNAAKSGFSESFPELWPFAMGALFIGVVLAFPNGLAGLYQTYVMPLEDKLFKRSKGARVEATPAKPAAERKPKTEKTDDYDPMIDSYSPEKS
jgi:urea transport system permease protein